jgi:hypothetical protein
MQPTNQSINQLLKKYDFMNLYIVVLNFDTYSLSILVTDATYVIFGIINDLTIIILPTIIYRSYTNKMSKKTHKQKFFQLESHSFLLL